MTRDEVKKLILITKRSFPNWNLGDDNALSETIDVWTAIFCDDDYEAIEAGLMNYIRNDTSGFAPSPGQIRSGISEMADPYDDTEEMIAILRKAIGRSSYYYEDEFWKLPELLRRAVGKSTNLRTWAHDIDPNELESVVFSQVKKTYRNIREQEKKLRKMEPIKRETLEKVHRKLEDVYRPSERPLIEDNRPTVRIIRERTVYEMQLKAEEREGILVTWNRKGLFPISEIMISPARDRKLRAIIDQIGIESLIAKEAKTEAKTFGQFLDEFEEEMP